MWFFDWFRDGFSTARTWLNILAGRIEGIPLLGSWIGYPVRYLEWAAGNLTTAAQSASYWADSIPTGASQIFSSIRPTLESYFPILTDPIGYVWPRIRPYIQSYFPILTDPIGYVWPRIRPYIQSYFPILTDPIGYVWPRIQPYIQSYFPILTDPIGYVWPRVRDSYLGAWFDQAITGAKYTITAIIEGQIEYLIGKAFSVLDRSWSTFSGSFAWLLDKLISLMFEQAAHFAPRLWPLFEAVLKNVETKKE